MVIFLTSCSSSPSIFEGYLVLLGLRLINGAGSKHATKCINSRIAIIKSKKRAMVRFLKKDVADLLAGACDDIAYGRMDALIVEINHAYCYDMIGQCCESILKQLPTLQKERIYDIMIEIPAYLSHSMS
ncbi:putative IST1-like protein [Cocos nucifera]|uniref:Putative IST1-like protein n=1 Tax=Cocos nucifera TaxID=13894 RepID=A0A8K0N5N3_COCNU|nr:putative IST1-like protein [Cocos nucifera]